MTQPPDDRSRVAIAYQWASQIMAVSLAMVLPGVIGYWLDRRLGTGFLLTVVGVVLGQFIGMKHLLQMTRDNSPGA